MHRLACSLALLFALTVPLHAAATVLESGDYATDAAAQAAWRATDGSAPVTTSARGDAHAVRFNADFTGNLRRVVADRDLKLDLTQWDRLTMDVYVDSPGLVSGYGFYFRSGPGWYSGSFQPTRRGWQTVEFTRASFGTEGQPAGWDRVDGIRVCGWRGAPRTGWFAIANLTGHREEIVVVTGTNTIAKRGSEARGVTQFADQLFQRLRQAGVSCGAIGDEQVEAGALAGRKIAIFAYSPDCSDAEVTAVEKYVAGGGKILVCYSAPPRLLTLLGLKYTGSLTPEQGHHLASIRFSAPDIQGLPAEVRQRSWRSTVVEPIAARTRTIGWWHDADGRRLGPAFALSDVGGYLGHVLLDDDPEGKSRLLLALLGHFDASVWQAVAAQRLRGPARIGLCDGRDGLLAWARRRTGAGAAHGKLAEEARLRSAATQQLADRRYAEAVATAAQADAALREAWLLAQRSKPLEFRAVWNHSGTGAWPGDWERSMRNLRAGGLNAVLPNVLWAGQALYASELLPVDPLVAKLGDQLAAAVAAGRKHGIEVHPWKVNWNLANAPQAFKARLAAEGRLMIDAEGKQQDWLEPSDPRNADLEVATMVEMARKYDVDGIHFDYIRYPGDVSYGPAVRERFERATGLTLEKWPSDVRRPDIHPKWVQWRCDNISQVVRRVAEEVRRIKPHCKISAAVFSNYPNCREDVGQDWAYWAKQGWVDFLCPMDYTNSDSAHAGTISSQLRHVAGAVPLYPGIGVTLGSWTLTADRVAGQIEVTRQMGADGFTLFNYSDSVADEVLPGLALGVLRTPAATGAHGPRFAFDLGEARQSPLYARQAADGETIRATVSRRPDPAGRTLAGVTGDIVLEDTNGQVAARLGAVPAAGQTVTVEFTAKPGLWRLAARGEARLGDRLVPYVSRSVLVQCGDLPAEVSALL